MKNLYLSTPKPAWSSARHSCPSMYALQHNTMSQTNLPKIGRHYEEQAIVCRWKRGCVHIVNEPLRLILVQRNGQILKAFQVGNSNRSNQKKQLPNGIFGILALCMLQQISKKLELYLLVKIDESPDFHDTGYWNSENTIRLASTRYERERI